MAELEPALVAALDALATMRCREGAALTQALRRHLDEIEGVLLRILGRTSDLVTAHRNRLRERVADCSTAAAGSLRLEQEVALLAERATSRRSAIGCGATWPSFARRWTKPGARAALGFPPPGNEPRSEHHRLEGRRCEFGQDVVELKTAIERLREQVQNIE